MRRIQAEGGTSAFSWVADSSSRLVVTATTRRYFFRQPAVTPFCEGVMRRTKRGWDPSFFWQFVNGTHGTADCLKRVVPLGVILSVFDAFVPLLLAALPAALSYCLQATEPGAVLASFSDGSPAPP